MGNKKWLANLGLTLLSVIICLLSLELILRFTSYGYLLNKDNYIRNYYRNDPEKGFDIRPNVKGIGISVDNGYLEYEIWSNELCCFDRPYRGERDVILLAGDSFTHMFAPFEEKWGTRIEKLLDYRVLKCGVSGYGTRQEYLKAREIIAKTKTKPRLIIVGYFWNDISDDYCFPNLTVVDGFLVPSVIFENGEPVGKNEDRDYSFWEKINGTYPLGPFSIIRFFLQQHSVLITLASDTCARYFPPPYSSPHPADSLAFREEDWIEEEQVWEGHEKNLKLFNELAQANGGKLLVVLIPSNTQVYPFLTDWGQIDPERPNKILGKFFQEEHIEYLDLLPLFKGYAEQERRRSRSSENGLYWRYNSHWNLRGERLAGLLVAKHILEKDLVKVAEKDEKLRYIEAQLRDFR